MIYNIKLKRYKELRLFYAFFYYYKSNPCLLQKNAENKSQLLHTYIFLQRSKRKLDYSYIFVKYLKRTNLADVGHLNCSHSEREKS